MRMYDIIARKRDGQSLSDKEIAYVVQGYTADQVPDYQMAAFLMAVFFRGMDARETAVLTNEMAKSGDMIDLSAMPGIKVDKHSTGGVGDKTTLVAIPLAAACGVSVAKMSGRGLGHTGGTVDKMEAVPGLKTSLSQSEFIKQVSEIGLAVIGQSGNLAPADKKIYALRDVTATVNSIPLIASSIMSKKLAAGADAILLDVKVGTGAFMKDIQDAIALAKAMVSIGEENNRRTAALITNMNMPLGCAIGNSLELAEVVQTLRGQGPEDLSRVSLEITANMLQLAGQGSHAQCLQRARAAISDESGYKKLWAMVKAQGGDVSVIEDPAKFVKASFEEEVKAQESGYISAMQTEGIGIAAMLLGAGREKKEDDIDYSAGICLLAKTGDRVEQGQVIARLYSGSREKLAAGKAKYVQSISLQNTPPKKPALVLARVNAGGVENYV